MKYARLRLSDAASHWLLPPAGTAPKRSDDRSHGPPPISHKDRRTPNGVVAASPPQVATGVIVSIPGRQVETELP